MANACGSAAGSISSRSAVPKRLSASSAFPAASWRSARSSGDSGSSAATSCTTSSPPPPSMPRVVSTNTEGGSSSVSRAASRNAGTARSRSSAAGARSASRAVPPREHRVEPLEDVRQPEGRVAHVGLLVLQPEDRARESRPEARCGRSPPAGRRSPAPRPRPRPTAGRRDARAPCSVSNRPSRESCDTSPAALAAAGSKWYLRSR